VACWLRNSETNVAELLPRSANVERMWDLDCWRESTMPAARVPKSTNSASDASAIAHVLRARAAPLRYVALALVMVIRLSKDRWPAVGWPIGVLRRYTGRIDRHGRRL